MFGPTGNTSTGNVQQPRIYENSPRLDNHQIYNKKTTFDIPSYGQLAMLFLIFEIQASGVCATKTPTSFYFPEFIELMDSGNIIARSSSEHALLRLDKYDSSQIQIITNGATLSAGITTAVQTVSFPLFFWPIDGQLLDTNNRKLTLRYQGKANAQEMGITLGAETLTLFNMRIKCVYDTFKTVPLNLSDAYNSFQYGPQIIPVDTTETKSLINVNVPVYSIGFLINDSAGVAVKINSVTLLYPNGSEEVYTNFTNYTLKKIVGSETFSGYTVPFNNTFGKENQDFNRFRAPVRCTITHEASGANAVLQTVFEYHSVIKEKTDVLSGYNCLYEEIDMLY